MSSYQHTYQFLKKKRGRICYISPFEWAFLFQLVQITVDEKKEEMRLSKASRTGIQDKSEQRSYALGIVVKAYPHHYL